MKKVFNKQLSTEKENHVIASKYRKSIIPKIKNELSYLAEQTNTDRALLFEYSNGTSNLVGLPFLYATATVEVVRCGVKQVSHFYQKLNVSLFADFIEKLEDHSYYYFKDIEEIKELYPMLYNYMRPNDIKSALFYALYDEDNSIGFLVVTTVNNQFDRGAVLPKIAEVAQLISSFLNYDKIKNVLK